MLDEFMVVLAYRPRSVYLFAWGIVCSLGLLMLGAHMTAELQLGSLGSSLTEVIREKLLRRYDRAALGVFILFTVGSIRLYLKDRRRLMG